MFLLSSIFHTALFEESPSMRHAPVSRRVDDMLGSITISVPHIIFLQQMDEPFEVFEESPSMRRAPVSRRVDDMFEQIKSKLPGAPRFLLCLLPERKNCEVYGWFIFGCLRYPSI